MIRFFISMLVSFIAFTILEQVTMFCFNCGPDAYEVTFARWSCCLFGVVGMLSGYLLGVYDQSEIDANKDDNTYDDYDDIGQYQGPPNNSYYKRRDDL